MGYASLLKPLDRSHVALWYIVLIPTTYIFMASVILWKKARISEKNLSVLTMWILLWQKANWEANNILQ